MPWTFKIYYMFIKTDILFISCRVYPKLFISKLLKPPEWCSPPPPPEQSLLFALHCEHSVTGQKWRSWLCHAKENSSNCLLFQWAVTAVCVCMAELGAVHGSSCIRLIRFLLDPPADGLLVSIHHVLTGYNYTCARALGLQPSKCDGVFWIARTISSNWPREKWTVTAVCLFLQSMGMYALVTMYGDCQGRWSLARGLDSAPWLPGSMARQPSRYYIAGHSWSFISPAGRHPVENAADLKLNNWGYHLQFDC